MIALEIGHLDLVRILIEAGANVNQSDKVGVCALSLYSISAYMRVLPWFLRCNSLSLMSSKITIITFA